VYESQLEPWELVQAVSIFARVVSIDYAVLPECFFGGMTASVSRSVRSQDRIDICRNAVVLAGPQYELVIEETGRRCTHGNSVSGGLLERGEGVSMTV
jgi:hypothetical protein